MGIWVSRLRPGAKLAQQLHAAAGVVNQKPEQTKPGWLSTDSRARDRASADGGRRLACTPGFHGGSLVRKLEHAPRARQKKSALDALADGAHAARAYASGHQKDVVAPRQTFGKQPASMYSGER